MSLLVLEIVLSLTAAFLVGILAGWLFAGPSTRQRHAE